MKVVARSASTGQAAYLAGFSDGRELVWVGSEGAVERPPDVAAIPLPALMAQPYGDWELVEEPDGDTPNP